MISKNKHRGRLQSRLGRHTTHTEAKPQNHTRDRRTGKTEPYSRNTKAPYPSVGCTISRRTNSPTKTTGKSDHGNPGRRKTGPWHTASYPTKGRKPRNEEDRPKAHCVYQPKGYKRRMRKTGHRPLHLSSRLNGSCQISKTPQGQRKQGS